MPENVLWEISAWVSQETIEVSIRILVAALLSALIGLERDLHGRAAGLRTHLLVGMGAALFTALSERMAMPPEDPAAPTSVSDPARIAAQVVTGIGFLGAGAILKEGLTIRGLTTAACLWVVAAIGMAAGGGYYGLAVATTIGALSALVMLKWFERSYPKDTYRRLTVVFSGPVELSAVLAKIREDRAVQVLLIDMQRDYSENRTTVEVSLRVFSRGLLDETLQALIARFEAAEFSLVTIRWEH